MLMSRILVRLIVVSNMSIRKSRNINMHVNGNKIKSIWSCCAIRKETEKRRETWNLNLGIYYRSSAQFSSLSPINTEMCSSARILYKFPFSRSNALWMAAKMGREISFPSLSLDASPLALRWYESSCFSPHAGDGRLK